MWSVLPERMLMTLDEFKEQLYEEMIQFTEYWKNNSESDPNFPKEMSEGDWREQLDSFIELTFRKT